MHDGVPMHLRLLDFSLTCILRLTLQVQELLWRTLVIFWAYVGDEQTFYDQRTRMWH